jgi:hypothetical protein
MRHSGSATTILKPSKHVELPELQIHGEPSVEQQHDILDGVADEELA